MKREEFYNIISEGTINGEVAGNIEGHIENVDFVICACGDYKEQQYYVSAIIDNNNSIREEGTDIEKYYSDFNEAINDFKIKGKPIAQQIEKIKDFGFIEYIN